jgi:hypothetical protein
MKEFEIPPPARFGPSRSDIAMRFWNQVDKSGGCWTWKGRKSRKGHGRFAFPSEIKWRFVSAHRYSYFLYYGDFDPYLLVCHRCDNPPCVRPDHLFLGTHSDNMQDALKKGRRRVGSDHWSSKLDEDSVREIRELYAGKLSSQSELARRFGVGRTTISRIIRRKMWSHLP